MCVTPGGGVQSQCRVKISVTPSSTCSLKLLLSYQRAGVLPIQQGSVVMLYWWSTGGCNLVNLLKANLQCANIIWNVTPKFIDFNSKIFTKKYSQRDTQSILIWSVYLAILKDNCKFMIYPNNETRTSLILLQKLQECCSKWAWSFMLILTRLWLCMLSIYVIYYVIFLSFAACVS